MNTSSRVNGQILMVKRPQGDVTPDCFKWVETPLSPLKDGEVLVKNQWLSLDPYMRGRMDESRSYATSQALDSVMVGGTAGVVIESRHAKYKAGDRVVGGWGWQEYGQGDPASAALQKISGTAPLSVYLGSVGMPGVTAWYGVNRIIAPKAGETVVVTAASGAVGSVVGHLAQKAGARAVGIAGGPAKCAYIKDTLGFDAAIDYKKDDWKAQLKAAIPKGIDGVFENVGGQIFDTLLARMNAFGRVAVCGLISGYNGQPIPMQNVRSILVNRLKVEGFIVSDHLSDWGTAMAELDQDVSSGKLKYRETIAEGLKQAPTAFIGLLRGENFGKQLVRLSDA